MDGVNVVVSGIDTDKQSSNPDFIKNCTESHMPMENTEILTAKSSLSLKDSSTGKKVAVTGMLKNYSITNEKLTVTLDEFNVPVESITTISPKGERT